MTFIFPLLLFHVFLIFKGTTTHQYLNKSETNKVISIKPEVFKIKEYTIRNNSACSMVPLNYVDNKPKVK